MDADIVAALIGLVAIVMFFGAVNIIAFSGIWAGGYCLENYGTSQITHANPAWFSCGEEIDFTTKNYHVLGQVPPFTIQTYRQWSETR